MRSLTLISAAIAALTALSGVPAMAGNHLATMKFNSAVVRHYLCIAPAQLENVCVAWGPGQPGLLFGPCIKYQLQCVSPANIH